MSGNGRKLVAALAVGLGLSVAPAQTPPANAVDQAKQKLAAKESAIAAEVAEVLKTAPGVAKVDMAKAVRNLTDMRAKVAGEAISEPKRKELNAQLEAAITGLGKGGPATPVEAKVDAAVLDRVLKSEKNQKAVDAAKQEAKEVDAAISAYANALEGRKEAEAKRTLAGIAAKYPNNPSIILIQGQQTNADAIQAARDIASLSGDRFRLAMNDVQRSAIPPLGDIEFPKDWKEKMERRRKLNAPKLTAEEEKLLKSLDTLIKGGLKDAPFQEAVQLLSTAIDQKIYVDAKSLEGRGVNLDDKVDVPGGVSARSALRVMLQTKGLTFVLRENVIQVVTVEDAKKQCVARAYDVRDLVSSGVFVGNLGPWGAYLDYEATVANAQFIIDAIKKGVEPSAWDSNGGVGSITFHYGTMSIIVRAPSEVHADLYRKMGR